MISKDMKAPMDNTTVILKRTFNQKIVDQNLNVIGEERYWRVMGPKVHKNYHSDLSLDGLKQWGII